MKRKIVRRILFLILFVAAPLSFGDRTFAQDAPQAAASYHSDIDDLLTIEKVTVLPFTDNLEGIYARPLEADFIQMVQGMHRWDYVPANSSGPLMAPEELESAPDKAKLVVQGTGAQAFFACRITKGPSGIVIHLSLFLSQDGKLLLQAVLKDYKVYALKDLKEQMKRLLDEILNRVPYSGRILSRDGNRITVNLGTDDGLKNNQVLSVIQIIKATRHPKFNFLINTEKEIIGRVKILKVDETLSFGMILSEKERGAVQKNSKIGPLDFVTYSTSDNLSLTPTPEDDLAERQDGKVAFGKNAHEWRPEDPPSFGQIGARIGLSRFTENAQVNSGVGSLSASDDLAPSVNLEGELWITPEWTFFAHLMQGILSTGNPRSGSAPSHLNQSLSYYEAGFGYTIRLGAYAWSPTIVPYLGYFSYRLYVDSTDPLAYTTQQYTGFKFGVRGSTPLGGEGGLYGFGGQFSMAVNPSLHESPVTSGDSEKNNVVEFGIFGYRRMGQRLKLQVNLDFDMYSSNFTGDGGRGSESATSTSQRYTTLSGGVYYMF